MIDRETLENALGFVGLEPDQSNFIEAIEAAGHIQRAARELLALMPCGTCNGTQPESQMWACKTCREAGREDCHLNDDCVHEPCPACGGLRYDPETVELIAKADYEFATGLDWSPINPSESQYYFDKAVAMLDTLWKETPLHHFRPVADGDGECRICHRPIGSDVHVDGVLLSQTEIRTAAREEWGLNLELGHISVPSRIWNENIWLDHLAARTEYIVRQMSGVTVNWDFDSDSQAAYRERFHK